MIKNGVHGLDDESPQQRSGTHQHSFLKCIKQLPQSHCNSRLTINSIHVFSKEAKKEVQKKLKKVSSQFLVFFIFFSFCSLYRKRNQ